MALCQQVDLKSDIYDNRFQKLLGNETWFRLPAPIRYRFGKRLRGGASVVYQGQVVAMKMNLVGWMIAQLARLVGAPLPYDNSSMGQPAVVTVTEDAVSEGQFWIRQYGRSAGFPQVIHSSKRFTGPTGLEEYIGCGIGVALIVSGDKDSIAFKSDHYFLQISRWRIRMPRLLGPGLLEVVHQDLGCNQFKFSLALKSQLFGRMIQQDAVFHDNLE